MFASTSTASQTSSCLPLAAAASASSVSTFALDTPAPTPTTKDLTFDQLSELTLFEYTSAMTNPILAPLACNNTVARDFCLYGQDDFALDQPLFDEAGFFFSNPTSNDDILQSLKQMNQSISLNNTNPMATPQTPSLDLALQLNNWKQPASSSSASAPIASPSNPQSTSTGFESWAFVNDINKEIDNEAIFGVMDTPYESPFMTMGEDADLYSLALAGSLFPDTLASDVLFEETAASSVAPAATTITPQMMHASNDFFADLLLSKVQAHAPPTASTTAEAWSPESESMDDDVSMSGDSDDGEEYTPKTVSSASTAAAAPKSKKTIPLVGGGRTIKKTNALKRFGCNHPGCDRRFARLFNLNTHEKTHNPDQARPFDCPECPKAFSRKHDLQRHEASVHKGERNFACPTCEKPFSRQDGLRRHLLVKGTCSDLMAPAT